MREKLTNKNVIKKKDDECKIHIIKGFAFKLQERKSKTQKKRRQRGSPTPEAKKSSKKWKKAPSTPPPSASSSNLSSSSSSMIEPRKKKAEQPPKKEGSTSPGVCSKPPVEKKKQFKHDGVGKKSKKTVETNKLPPAAEIELTTKEKETSTNLAPLFRLGNEEVEAMSDGLEGMAIMENDPFGLEKEMTSVMAGRWPELSASDLALPLESEAAKMAEKKDIEK